jgi:hypothetical protein
MKKIISIISAFAFLQGCSSLTAGRHTLGSLSEIDVDMDKRMVQKVMGKPNVIRVGKKLADDKSYELHEYKLYDDASVGALSWFLILPASPFLGTETFWLHYINSKLVFWGAEGDWRGAPKWFSMGYSAPAGEPLAVEQMPSKVTEPK